MYINDVTKNTGLSKKSIRFYENKGLLLVERHENGYRFYSQDNIINLKKIKLLRSCGVSVTDIKLLFNDAITIEELLNKRKKEIEKEYGNYSNILSEISKTFKNYQNENFDSKITFDETLYNDKKVSNYLFLGIDIGTTTISGAIIDTKNNTTVETYTLPNNTYIKSSLPCFCEQSPTLILEKVKKLADLIIKTYPNLKAIGVTGQMHGIVYIDKNGNALSPFVNWQDKRGDEKFDDTCTYCEKIFEITNQNIFSGFGFATHFYNMKNKFVPKNVYCFCSIMDYVVMNLTGCVSRKIHSSVADSFGLFDTKKMNFDKKALEKLGINDTFIPDVTDEYSIVGQYKKIPVSIAIGDNQASFIGSVKNIDDTILINFGTGSQISFISDLKETQNTSLTTRPLVKDKYILCGSALCGGKAYAILENFFKSYVKEASCCEKSQYEILNNTVSKAYHNKIKNIPTVNTFFCGKRNEKNVVGSILNITEDNFTPEHIALGFVIGMCNELFDFIKDNKLNKKTVIASGNAVRKIPILKNVIEDVFQLPVQISNEKEEASVGAGLFAAIATEYFKNINEATTFIKYKKE